MNDTSEVISSPGSKNSRAGSHNSNSHANLSGNSRRSSAHSSVSNNLHPVNPVPITLNNIRRRFTTVNPNFKIQDVQKALPPVTSTSTTYLENKKKLKPDKTFKYKCIGNIEEDENGIGNTIEWNASFQKPLEQLIYPSLQRFNNEEYEEKKKFYETWHGRSAGQPVSFSKYDDSLEVNFYNSKNANENQDQIKSQNDMKVFLYTPTWTATITNREDHHLQNQKAMNLLEEIDCKGEVYLRESIKQSYIDQKAQEEFELNALKLINERDQYLPRSRRHQLDAKPISHAPDPETADGLYALMTQHHNMLKNLKGQSNESSKLNKLSSEEMAFNQQKKHLMSSTPTDQSHLLDGILYYRLHNQLNQAEIAERKALETQLMTVRPDKHNRKLSNTFSLRLQARSKRNSTINLFSKNLNEVHAMKREEEFNLVQPDQLHSTQYLAQINLTRIQRAKGSKYGGFNRPVDVNKMLPKISNSVTMNGGGYNTNTSHVSFMSPSNSYAPNDSSIFDGSINLQPSLELPSDEMNAMPLPLPTPHLPPVAGASSTPSILKQSVYSSDSNPEYSRRLAQDNLLLMQLDSGILPEMLIKDKSSPEELTIDLSNFGIGDTRGLCLGKCLSNLDHLQSLGLSQNRLTALSLPTIISNLNSTSVMHLDLSFNAVNGFGAKALGTCFRGVNSIRYLDLSNCGLQSVDLKEICTSCMLSRNNLEELYLSCNDIDAVGAIVLCQYLSHEYCTMNALDMSWNSIGEQGAINFATALAINKTLTSLNLSSNSMNDYGGQRLVASFSQNTTIYDIDISQNGFTDGTAFVVAQTLGLHPSIRNLNLSLNPLGEAGARSIFRTILRGMRCFITMRDCAYHENPNVFNYTYPSADNPYHLDLAEPQHVAILHELIRKVSNDPINCSFENVQYRELGKLTDVSINLIEANKKVVVKSTGAVWNPPNSGTLKFHFNEAVFIPTLERAVDDNAFNIMQVIIEMGRSENDRKQWLKLLSQDLYFTTKQAQSMIDRFMENKTIGAGGLRKIDILNSLWRYLLDTENMFDFLCANADINQRKDLAFALTLKRYKFNWINPTGNWTLNLNDKTQRAIMMQIVAINNYESDHSRLHSGRHDTSQSGNWFNFRNEKYHHNGTTNEIIIDKEFLKNLPQFGTIEFDYVSTRRPHKYKIHQQGSDDHQHNSNNKSDEKLKKIKSQKNEKHITVDELESDNMAVESINDDNFFDFMSQLGLSSRHKINSSIVLYKLLDLQVASAKYYFSIINIISILEAFEDNWNIQAKVIIIMFSRILELHKLDILLRSIDAKAQHEIILRLGCLNVFNPLKISFAYRVSLKHLDNRILVVALMELASIESADQIQEDPGTELPIQTLYGSYTRALNETRPEVMKFTYCDFGVRIKTVSWSARRDLLKKFLVGTTPLDQSMFQVITMYKEMEAANALTSGPIDLQYSTFMKNSHNRENRSLKRNKKIQAAMKSVA